MVIPIGPCAKVNNDDAAFPKDMAFLINHIKNEVSKKRTLKHRVMCLMLPGYEKKMQKDENKIMREILSRLLCADISALQQLGLGADVSIEGPFNHSHPNSYKLLLSGKKGASELKFSTKIDCRTNAAVAMSYALKSVCSYIWEPATEANFYNCYNHSLTNMLEDDVQVSNLCTQPVTFFFPSGRVIEGRWFEDSDSKAFMAGNIAIVSRRTSISMLYRLRKMRFLLGSTETDVHGRRYILPDDLRIDEGVWKAKISPQGGTLFRLMSGIKTEDSLYVTSRKLRNSLPIDGDELDIEITVSNQHISTSPLNSTGTFIYGISVLSRNLNCPIVVHCLIPDMSSRTLTYHYNLANSTEAKSKINAQIKNNLNVFEKISCFEKTKTIASFLQKYEVTANGRQTISSDNLRIQFAAAIVTHRRLEVLESEGGIWIISCQSGRFPFSINFKPSTILMSDCCIPEINEHFFVTRRTLLDHKRFIESILVSDTIAAGSQEPI